MVNFNLDDRRKIGIGLTGFGVLFLFLGVLFFFDKGLLSMGNILFLAGVTLTIGPQATARFFTKKSNHKGSAAYLGGLFLVIYMGWPLIGSVVEMYGFVLLFSAFFPTVLMFLKKIPVLGRILDLPGVKTLMNKIAPAQLPV